MSSKDEISEYESVGKVLPNYSVYILDENTGEPVPLGYPGEICIGGGGLALGYLNLPELSAAKFVPNPFAGAEDLARGWTRMFKTGDRGRFQADGSLVFMGRRQNDNMIKLRGLRIDLDDVANTILHTADNIVAEAAVTLRGEEDSQFLVAHVVPRQGQVEVPTDVEWQKLAQRLPLPVYMRPSLIVAIDYFPRTTNGKIDYRALQTADLPTFNWTAGGANQKLSLEEGELSLLWEEVFEGSMAVSRVNLTRDSDFFLVGGSSLLLMKLQGAIRETLGISVTVAELYQASTIGRMAAHIHREKGAQSPLEAIDWETETQFLPSPVQLDAATITAPIAIRQSNREVLLTGAHTFLGSEILQALVSDNSVKRVHCIAVPATAINNKLGNKKAAYYPGSLQSETLGLNSDDITFLQSRVDLIIHAGSVGHCLNNYSSVRAPNVGSLQFLVNLAIPRHIPVHFISSNRVTLLSGENILPPVSVGQYKPPVDGSEGFTASKWAGERLLENVSTSTNLPITVHRPCALVGPNAPSEDALNSLLRFALEQNAVPRFRNLTGFLDFAPITAVAANIARSALQVDLENIPGFCVANVAPAGKNSINIVHHSSGFKTPIEKFRSRMEELHGRKFGELDITDWINEAVKRGMDPLISTYLEAIVEKNRTIAFPYLGEPLKMET
jgi:thioester reductase-like protein/aryl carrier-like protein